jgi:hypothetical protein
MVTEFLTESKMNLHEEPRVTARINLEIYEILGKQPKLPTSSDEWKMLLLQLEQLQRKSFDGTSCNEDIYRAIALVRLRIGLCLEDEDRLAEAVEYFKQVWIQIGAFEASDENEREFVYLLAHAAARAGSRLIPMRGERSFDDVIAGRVALGITNAAFQLLEPRFELPTTPGSG